MSGLLEQPDKHEEARWLKEKGEGVAGLRVELSQGNPHGRLMCGGSLFAQEYRFLVARIREQLLKLHAKHLSVS